MVAILTRPDISMYYSSVSKAIHWKAALGILAYINKDTSWCGIITQQRETAASISIEVFADVD